MFEYSPVPWCIIFLPKAVTIWEKIKEEMNKIIKPMWVQNLYLPMLIPMSFFEKEKDHVDGFAPELAIVTIWWAKELDDKLAIRPTSETLFCEFFRNNLTSYRDLPLLYNQWVNVMRREKRTRPFLRTAEFYWQEWHTLHETTSEAYDFSKNILNNVYIKILRELLAIDWIAWNKSESEKFAWAETTFTFEPMMSNGWALQICTSHVLWEWFMKQFDVKFQDRDWNISYPAYTSWGLSTRSIWGLISSHSDDKGLIIPPKLSEYKAVILPIYWKENEEKVNEYVAKIAEKIVENKSISPVKWEYFKKFVWAENSVLVDYRNVRLWEKITDFELSGYPIRIECGERDIEASNCVIVSRITQEKLVVSIDEINKTVDRMLEEWQTELLKRSTQRLKSNVVPCYSIEEIWQTLEAWKFAIYEWDKNPKFEVEIKEKFKGTTRCIPFKWQFTDDLLQVKNPNNVAVIVARAF
jgi:prolyl-tRNA synthetase